jgi:hypothetical protein
MNNTAVEWLIGQLENHYVKQDLKNTIVYQQAKEMEKEQIMNAWYNGFEENRPYVDHSEDYYIETYKQD